MIYLRTFSPKKPPEIKDHSWESIAFPLIRQSTSPLTALCCTSAEGVRTTRNNLLTFMLGSWCISSERCLILFLLTSRLLEDDNRHSSTSLLISSDELEPAEFLFSRRSPPKWPPLLWNSLAQPPSICQPAWDTGSATPTERPKARRAPRKATTHPGRRTCTKRGCWRGTALQSPERHRG